MRRSIAVTAALATALVATAWSPSVAEAGTNNSVWSAGHVNEASFVAYGDDLFNCDYTADGHHAVVQWVDGRDPGKVHTARNKGGNGTCTNALAGVNLAEGSGIAFHSCIGEGTRIYSCGPDVTAVA